LALGLIAGSGPMDALRREAYVDPQQVALDDARFSARIRAP
jgi:hypothetical protein